MDEEWKFIGTIPKGTKPCYYDKSLVYLNEWFVTWKRRWKGEKGEKGVIYIENLIENTRKSLENLDVNSLKSLKCSLQKALEGLTNLVYTYKMDDQESVSKSYSELIIKTEALVEEINKHLRNKTNFFSYIPKIL